MNLNFQTISYMYICFSCFETAYKDYYTSPPTKPSKIHSLP